MRSLTPRHKGKEAVKDETEVMKGGHHGERQRIGKMSRGRDETGMMEAMGDGEDRGKEPAVGILTGSTDSCFHQYRNKWFLDWIATQCCFDSSERKMGHFGYVLYHFVWVNSCFWILDINVLTFQPEIV